MPPPAPVALRASLLATLLAGCASPEPTPAAQASDPPTGPPPDPSQGPDRVVLVDDAAGDIAAGVPVGQMESDLLCLLGGGPELERTSARVLPGTGHLEVRLRIDPTYTGVQVGHALDGGEVTWLPLVPGGQAATQEVPVDPAAWEGPGARRWAFYEQMNVPGAEQPCSTGGGFGRCELTVEAVRSPAGPTPAQAQP